MSDPLSRFHFVGIQAVEASVFDDVRENEPSEIVRTVYPQLIAKQPGALRIYRTGAEFHDIGTPADYLATARRFGESASSMQVGRDTYVHPTARITSSVLWDRVTVGADAEIVDCVVADDVAIPAGARHARQTIVQIGGKTIVAPLS